MILSYQIQYQSFNLLNGTKLSWILLQVKEVEVRKELNLLDRILKFK